MLEKMMLSEKECEHLTKSIAGGVGIGLSLGAVFNNPQFYFALGGVVGIVFSLIYILIHRSKQNKINNEIIN